jgi:hypothetical protein
VTGYRPALLAREATAFESLSLNNLTLWPPRFIGFHPGNVSHRVIYALQNSYRVKIMAQIKAFVFIFQSYS